MPRRVVFLESLHGVESLFTRGLRHGAAAYGWRTEVLFLRGPGGEPLPEAEIRSRIAAANPDVVSFLMDAPLAWETLWSAGPLRETPKLSFWYDDFLRSPLTMSKPGVWRRWQEEENVSVFLHDGHWREQWQSHTGIHGRRVLRAELSADPAIGEGDAPPLFPQLRGHAVMVGTIPSAASLREGAAAFPPVVGKWIGAAARAMEGAPWPFRAYEIAAGAVLDLAPKEQAVLGKWLADPAAKALAHHQIWRWGKRIARLRGLRALARRGVPLAVLSGHGTEAFAREAELRAELGIETGTEPGKGASFVFVDTTEIPASKWGSLYRSGGLQVQWTDPQSIESGAPFRLFEAAAAGVPLLSDSRPGYAALFEPEREMFFAPDEEALADRAAALLAEPPALSELPAAGARARETFLLRHTWGRRWRDAVEAVASGTAANAQPPPAPHGPA